MCVYVCVCLFVLQCLHVLTAAVQTLSLSRCTQVNDYLPLLLTIYSVYIINSNLSAVVY